MLRASLAVQPYLDRLSVELNRVDLDQVERWSELIYQAWQNDRFVFLLGNGGSGTTASHMSEDLGKSTLPPDALHDESKQRLKVLSLTDNAGWIMAVANDISYSQIFLQQLMNYGTRGDLVIAISGSGNSENVLNAVEWANRHGLMTFGLSGYDGGRLKQVQQDGLHVELDDMGMVESIHLCLFHWVLDDVYARINAEGQYAGKTTVAAWQQNGCVSREA